MVGDKEPSHLAVGARGLARRVHRGWYGVPEAKGCPAPRG